MTRGRAEDLVSKAQRGEREDAPTKTQQQLQQKPKKQEEEEEKKKASAEGNAGTRPSSCSKSEVETLHRQSSQK
jgi:hypothetical protein